MINKTKFYSEKNKDLNNLSNCENNLVNNISCPISGSKNTKVVQSYTDKNVKYFLDLDNKTC